VGKSSQNSRRKVQRVPYLSREGHKRDFPEEKKTHLAPLSIMIYGYAFSHQSIHISLTVIKEDRTLIALEPLKILQMFWGYGLDNGPKAHR